MIMGAGGNIDIMGLLEMLDVNIADLLPMLAGAGFASMDRTFASIYIDQHLHSCDKICGRSGNYGIR